MRILRAFQAVALAMAIGVTASGCSTHEVDRKAWARELSEAGQPNPDFDKLEKVTRDLCDFDAGTLKTFVAVQRDAEQSMESVRIGFRNVCPDQLNKLTDAENALDDATDLLKEACTTPADKRTRDQKDLAEAMRCD